MGQPTDGSCTNRWSNNPNDTYYDRSDGLERRISDTLAIRDYIDSISGVDESQDTVSYPRALQPGTKVNFDEGTYSNDEEDE